MQITNETIIGALESAMPGVVLRHDESYGMLNIEAPREQIIPALKFLKEDERTQMMFLTTACASHFPDDPGRELCMMYQLHNLPANKRMRVKTYFPIDDARLPTATTLWAAANWMEREAYDFFGVVFEGHPNLKRILNVEDMQVFPLRKEYRLEDGTRTDKDDRFFGRDGNEGIKFD
ncbi:MAG: NADH-quinone oxidoreductase subunit C [Saprospiraceae bacterium]